MSPSNVNSSQKNSHQSTTSSFLGFCSATALATVVAKGGYMKPLANLQFTPKCYPPAFLFVYMLLLHVLLSH